MYQPALLLVDTATGTIRSAWSWADHGRGASLEGLRIPVPPALGGRPTEALVAVRPVAEDIPAALAEGRAVRLAPTMRF